MVWAEYAGGEIEKGFLIGKVVDQHLEFTYQHVNKKFKIMTGNCTSYPEEMKNEKLKIQYSNGLDL